MSSRTRVRFLGAASALMLAATAACASGPVRPTTPLSSNDLRPDPTRPMRPPSADPSPSAPVMPTFAESSNAYLPRHLPGAQQMNLKRIAVLLPF